MAKVNVSASVDAFMRSADQDEMVESFETGMRRWIMANSKAVMFLKPLDVLEKPVFNVPWSGLAVNGTQDHRISCVFGAAPQTALVTFYSHADQAAEFDGSGLGTHSFLVRPVAADLLKVSGFNYLPALSNGDVLVRALRELNGVQVQDPFPGQPMRPLVTAAEAQAVYQYGAIEGTFVYVSAADRSFCTGGANGRLVAMRLDNATSELVLTFKKTAVSTQYNCTAFRIQRLL